MPENNKSILWVSIVLGVGITFLCLVMSILLSSCSLPKTYEFQYSVDVRYEDNSWETLVSTTALETKNPEKIKFSISSRLRKSPCLILGEIETLNSTNIACDVKSFIVNVLKYKEVK